MDALKPERFLRRRFIRVAMVMVILTAGGLVIQQALLFSKSVSTGTVQKTYAEPLYGYKKSPPGLSRQASEKLGADYMCLYFAATNYLQGGTMYDIKSDPWGRPAVTFPPHLVYLVAHSIQRASFPISVLLNSFLQIGLLLVAAFLFVRAGGSFIGCSAGLVLVGFMLFCTPVGTTWFERSQTDLYVGVSSVFFLKGFRDDRPRDFVLSGIFGSLKWSSLPFLVSSALLYLWFSKHQASHKVRRVGTLLTVACLLPFVMGRDSLDYLKLVANSELHNHPMGASLGSHLPVFLSKIAVFALATMMIVLHRFWKKTTWNIQSIIETMFWGANGFICASYGTVAFEYRLVSTLFLVPFLVCGRSILFPEAHQQLSLVSRLCGVVIVLLTFRTQAHLAVVDSLLRHGRADIPLFASITLLITISLWASRPGAGVRIGEGGPRADVRLR